MLQPCGVVRVHTLSDCSARAGVNGDADTYVRRLCGLMAGRRPPCIRSPRRNQQYGHARRSIANRTCMSASSALECASTAGHCKQCASPRHSIAVVLTQLPGMHDAASWTMANWMRQHRVLCFLCLLSTSDAADERSSVDLG